MCFIISTLNSLLHCIVFSLPYHLLNVSGAVEVYVVWQYDISSHLYFQDQHIPKYLKYTTDDRINAIPYFL